jgi:hypothetical protein
MAGDWIKMRSNLDTHPKVIAMACELSTTELHVVGMLWKVWTWADQHSLDGNAICVTESFLNRITCNAGFCAAMKKVGWLIGNDGELAFPRFTEHNGKTAKSRSETAVRVNKHREARNAKCNAKSVTNALPEKRREEKRREEGINPDITPHACEDFDEAKPAEPNPNLGDRPTFLTGPSAACKRFVATYPRKTSPATVWRVWDALIVTICGERGMTDAEVEEWLIERAAAYASSPAGMPPPPGQDDFRPSPAKWLEQGKYEEPQSEWNRPNGNGTGNASRRTGQTARDRATDTGEDLDALFDAIVSAKSASGVE